jgi:uncharacterized protein YecE (DUF72 family)
LLKDATSAAHQTRSAVGPFVGTAAWSIPRPSADAFSGEGSVLARYARRFRAVEINSSFYRPHRRATYERWAATVSGSFRFAVKAPRQITHELRLSDARTPLAEFFEQIAGLGETLGPVLIQLPPSLVFDNEVAGRFFDTWRALFDGFTVCEPRHPSWFSEPAEHRLMTAQVARVAADPALCPQAAVPGGFEGLAYYRLHGSPVMYDSSYADRLEPLAKTLADSALARPTWCIFDNTRTGAATLDALALVKRLGR